MAYSAMGLIVNRTDCGRGIRTPTNSLWGLGWPDIGLIIFGVSGRGALSAPAISKQGFPEFVPPQFANGIFQPKGLPFDFPIDHRFTPNLDRQPGQHPNRDDCEQGR